MPKRIICLDRGPDYQDAALWAAVPSGQEPKYRHPSTGSQYLAISASELNELRQGSVAERTARISISGLSEAQIEASLQTLWQQWQDAVTAGVEWAFYGKNWDGTTWTAGGPATVPAITRQDEEELPTFFVLTPLTAFAASRFHLVLHNNTTFYSLRIRAVIYLPQSAAVTGAAPSAWVLRRRKAPTTVPGGGVVTAFSANSQHVLPAGITAHSNPTTAPAGGTAEDFLPFVPQADEQKLSTLDAPTMASLQPFAGVAVWLASLFRPTVPLILNPNETLEVQQSATAGTGNARMLAVFSVKDAR